MQAQEAEIQGAKTYLCMMKCQELLPCSRTQWMHADPQREQFSINPDLFSCDLEGNIDNVVDGQEKGCSREDILVVICCYTGEKKICFADYMEQIREVHCVLLLNPTSMMC
uniref:Uncharacterized protein n=1 Tax=Triticum urartu TaxID=4572 RepID=A0A8R7UW25_TRIUA